MPARAATLPAASGYRVYAALKSPILAKAFIARYYPTTVTGRISSNSIVPSEIRQHGDQVIFREKPTAEIFPYQKNQDLEVSQLNTASSIMTIDRAYYYNLKLDKVDEKQIPDVRQWVNDFIEDAREKLAQVTDLAMQTELPHQADCRNKGPNAGARTGAFNLGTIGAPVTINKENLPDILGRLKAVLAEQNIGEGDFYVILPSTAKVLFWANPILANACASGNSKSIILTNGESIPDILGFDIIFSNTTPIYTDPVTGEMTFTLLAGRKDATGFVLQLNDTEVIDKDPRSFSKYWRGLTLWGFKLLLPKEVAVLYATFQFDTTA